MGQVSRIDFARNPAVYGLFDIDTSPDTPYCPKRCLQNQGKSKVTKWLRLTILTASFRRMKKDP
jgi:hypothetical protein